MKAFLRRHWPALLLIALPFLFLADVWFGGRMLFLRDFYFNDAAMRILHGEALRHGSFLLWYNCQCGIPGAAEPHSGAFYPPNWIFAIPWAEFAIRCWWTFHLAVAALGWYALARSWKLGVWPAMLAAVSFSFSTYLFTWIEGAPAFTSMVWGPLVLMLTGRILNQTAEARERGFGAAFKESAGSIVALAVAMALQLLANGEHFFYTGLITGLYAATWWVWKRDWKTVVYSGVLLGAAGVLAVGLAAPQWVLMSEFMPFSDRNGEIDSFIDKDSASPRHWLTFLLPFLYGRPGYPNVFWAPKLFEFDMCHCYLGLAPLVLAGFSWLWVKGPQKNGERRAQIVFLVILAAWGLVMAAGKFTPVYGFFHHNVPGFGHLRFAPKFYIFVAYAIALLGALGLQAVMEGGPETLRMRQRLWWGAAGCFSLFALGFLMCLMSDDFIVWLMGHPGTPSAMQRGDVLLDYALAILFSGTALGLCRVLAFKPIPPRWPQAGLVALAFVNLVAISRQIQPTMAGGLYTQKPDKLSGMIGNDTSHRFLSTYYKAQQFTLGEKRREIADWANACGATNAVRLEKYPVINPCWMSFTRYQTLLAGIETGPENVRERLADLVSLRYFTTGPGFPNILWGNAPKEFQFGTRPSALARAYLVSNWIVSADEPQTLSGLVAKEFEPRRDAFIEPLAGKAIPSPAPNPSAGDAGEVSGFADQTSSVTMDVSARKPALLVLTDSWYPGWTVKVDGVEQPVFRANYLFRGVFLQPGAHRVEFSYWPTHLTAALWLCALAIAGCGAVWGVSRFAPPTPEPASTLPARTTAP